MGKTKYNYIDEAKKRSNCKSHCVIIPISELGDIYERENSFEEANAKAKRD